HGGPGVDIAAGVAARLLLLAEMMHESSAAGLVLDHHHIDAVAPEQPDGRAIDLRRELLLHAAEQKRDARGRELAADSGFLLRELDLHCASGHERNAGGDM